MTTEKDEGRRIMNTNEMVNHPEHYAGHCSGECIEYIRLILGDKGTYDFCIGSIISYIWRYGFKNGMEDLEKASWFLSYAEEIMNDLKNDIFDEKNQIDNLAKMIVRYKYKEMDKNEN